MTLTFEQETNFQDYSTPGTVGKLKYESNWAKKGKKI